MGVTQINGKQIKDASVDLAVDVTGILPVANGGTNISTYAIGDILYCSAANVLTKLTGNISTNKQVLTQTGTGSASAAPVWGTVEDAVISTDTSVSDNESYYSDDYGRSVHFVAPNIWITAGLYVSPNSTQACIYLAGVKQTVACTAILASSNTAGVIIQGGFVYAVIVRTGVSAEFWRCPLTSSIATAGNWTKMTISGTALGTAATDLLLGFGSGKFWVVKGSGFVPYTLSGTTMTSGTTVTVTGSSYAGSRVNENGIYNVFSAAPFIRFSDFTGSLDSTKQLADTLGKRFCLPYSFYHQSNSGQSIARAHI